MTVVLGNIGRDCVIWTNLHVYIAEPIDILMTSHGNAFRITGPLCGESTIHRQIPLQRTRGAELWYTCIFCYCPEQVVEQIAELSMIWDAMTSLHHCILQYYCHRAKMRLIGREDDLVRINKKALQIAREVADETGTLMAGNLCNTNIYKPNNPDVDRQLREIFKVCKAGYIFIAFFQCIISV